MKKQTLSEKSSNKNGRAGIPHFGTQECSHRVSSSTHRQLQAQHNCSKSFYTLAMCVLSCITAKINCACAVPADPELSLTGAAGKAHKKRLRMSIEASCFASKHLGVYVYSRVFTAVVLRVKRPQFPCRLTRVSLISSLLCLRTVFPSSCDLRLVFRKRRKNEAILRSNKT